MDTKTNLLQSVTAQFAKIMDDGNFDAMVKMSSDAEVKTSSTVLAWFGKNYYGNAEKYHPALIFEKRPIPLSILAYLYCIVNGVTSWSSEFGLNRIRKTGNDVYRVVTTAAKAYMPDHAPKSMLDKVIGKDSYLQSTVFLPVYAALKDASEQNDGKYSDELVSMAWYVVGAYLYDISQDNQDTSEISLVTRLLGGTGAMNAFDVEAGSELNVVPVSKNDINTSTHLAPINIEFLIAPVDKNVKFNSGEADLTGQVLSALLKNIAGTEYGKQYIPKTMLENDTDGQPRYMKLNADGKEALINSVISEIVHRNNADSIAIIRDEISGFLSPDDFPADTYNAVMQRVFGQGDKGVYHNVGVSEFSTQQRGVVSTKVLQDAGANLSPRFRIKDVTDEIVVVELRSDEIETTFDVPLDQLYTFEVPVAIRTAIAAGGGAGSIDCWARVTGLYPFTYETEEGGLTQDIQRDDSVQMFDKYRTAQRKGEHALDESEKLRTSFRNAGFKTDELPLDLVKRITENADSFAKAGGDKITEEIKKAPEIMQPLVAAREKLIQTMSSVFGGTDNRQGRTVGSSLITKVINPLDTQTMSMLLETDGEIDDSAIENSALSIKNYLTKRFSFKTENANQVVRATNIAAEINVLLDYSGDVEDIGELGASVISNYYIDNTDAYKYLNSDEKFAEYVKDDTNNFPNYLISATVKVGRAIKKLRLYIPTKEELKETDKMKRDLHISADDIQLFNDIADRVSRTLAKKTEYSDGSVTIDNINDSDIELFKSIAGLNPDDSICESLKRIANSYVESLMNDNIRLDIAGVTDPDALNKINAGIDAYYKKFTEFVKGVDEKTDLPNRDIVRDAYNMIKDSLAAQNYSIPSIYSKLSVGNAVAERFITAFDEKPKDDDGMPAITPAADSTTSTTQDVSQDAESNGVLVSEDFAEVPGTIDTSKMYHEDFARGDVSSDVNSLIDLYRTVQDNSSANELATDALLLYDDARRFSADTTNLDRMSREERELVMYEGSVYRLVKAIGDRITQAAYQVMPNDPKTSYASVMGGLYAQVMEMADEVRKSRNPGLDIVYSKVADGMRSAVAKASAIDNMTDAGQWHRHVGVLMLELASMINTAGSVLTEESSTHRHDELDVLSSSHQRHYDEQILDDGEKKAVRKTYVADVVFNDNTAAPESTILHPVTSENSDDIADSFARAMINPSTASPYEAKGDQRSLVGDLAKQMVGYNQGIRKVIDQDPAIRRIAAHLGELFMRNIQTGVGAGMSSEHTIDQFGDRKFDPMGEYSNPAGQYDTSDIKSKNAMQLFTGLAKDPVYNVILNNIFDDERSGAGTYTHVQNTLHKLMAGDNVPVYSKNLSSSDVDAYKLKGSQVDGNLAENPLTLTEILNACGIDDHGINVNSFDVNKDEDIKRFVTEVRRATLRKACLDAATRTYEGVTSKGANQLARYIDKAGTGIYRDMQTFQKSILDALEPSINDLDMPLSELLIAFNPFVQDIALDTAHSKASKVMKRYETATADSESGIDATYVVKRLDSLVGTGETRNNDAVKALKDISEVYAKGGKPLENRVKKNEMNRRIADALHDIQDRFNIPGDDIETLVARYINGELASVQDVRDAFEREMIDSGMKNLNPNLTQAISRGDTGSGYGIVDASIEKILDKADDIIDGVFGGGEHDAETNKRIAKFIASRYANPDSRRSLLGNGGKVFVNGKPIEVSPNTVSEIVPVYKELMTKHFVDLDDIPKLVDSYYSGKLHSGKYVPGISPLLKRFARTVGHTIEDSSRDYDVDKVRNLVNAMVDGSHGVYADIHAVSDNNFRVGNAVLGERQMLDYVADALKMEGDTPDKLLPYLTKYLVFKKYQPTKLGPRNIVRIIGDLFTSGNIVPVSGPNNQYAVTFNGSTATVDDSTVIDMAAAITSSNYKAHDIITELTAALWSRGEAKDDGDDADGTETEQIRNLLSAMVKSSYGIYANIKKNKDGTFTVGPVGLTKKQMNGYVSDALEMETGDPDMLLPYLIMYLVYTEHQPDKLGPRSIVRIIGDLIKSGKIEHVDGKHYTVTIDGITATVYDSMIIDMARAMTRPGYTTYDSITELATALWSRGKADDDDEASNKNAEETESE